MQWAVCHVASAVTAMILKRKNKKTTITQVAETLLKFFSCLVSNVSYAVVS